MFRKIEICLLLIGLTGAISIATVMATPTGAANATTQTVYEIEGQKDSERKGEAVEISVNQSDDEEDELPIVSYEVKWFPQAVDHFSKNNTGLDTFRQKFLINTRYWCGKNCPILFYCGSAGDIEHIANITGWMWENAANLSAMLVFAEQRYYGSSLVYPINLTNIKEPKELAKLSYLSSYQALEDFHLLIKEIKNKMFPEASSSPVIAIGCSYGAMLAAWMRIKYPHVVRGALAASAPILVGSRDYDNNSYYKIITKSYETYSGNCAQSIRLSWKALRDYDRYGDDGLIELSSIFNLCMPLKDVNNLIFYLKRVWISLAHRDHAHTSIFSKTLPAYPVKQVCSILDEDLSHIRDEQLIQNIARASQVYKNYSGHTACLDLNENTNAITDNINSDTRTALWSYQVCTEFNRPIYSEGENDMFEYEPYNSTEFCKDRWGTSKRVNKTLYNDKESLNSASKIIFSFGSRDPWSAGCPQKNIEENSIHVIRMNGVCDCEDLFDSLKNDSTEVKEARKHELRIIKNWIGDYHPKISLKAMMSSNQTLNWSPPKRRED